MLEKEFHTIVRYFTEIFSNFLISIFPDEKEYFFKLDINKLINFFTENNNYEKIKSIMNWEDREMYNRAFMIKIIRNKYYHASSDFNVKKIEEINYITNLLLFCEGIESRLNNEDLYSQLYNLLKDMLYEVCNNYLDAEKKELDTKEAQEIQYEANEVKMKDEKAEIKTEESKEESKSDFSDDKLKKYIIEVFQKFSAIDEYDELKKWFHSVPSNTWKSLAGFAKNHKLLTPNGRAMLYKMGVYLEKGIDPSEAQLKYARTLYEKIIERYKNENE